jgi:hypothetical protein
MISTFPSNVPWYSKEHCFFEDSETFPDFASENSSIIVKTRLEHWWDNSGKEKPKYREANLS